MSPKILYKCTWHDGDGKNDKDGTLRVYADENGQLSTSYGGKIARKFAHPEYVLNEISSGVNSHYGYLKTITLNTAEFKRVFGTDNVMKYLQDNPR